jgi:hypothetical protein
LTQAHQPFPSTLSDLLAAELGALEEVLAATRTIVTALSLGRPGDLEGAVGQREDALRRLTAASKTRRKAARGHEIPSPISGRFADLSHEIRSLETESRELSARALCSLREELMNLQTGRRALSGYRQPRVREPRFSDRRG